MSGNAKAFLVKQAKKLKSLKIKEKKIFWQMVKDVCDDGGQDGEGVDEGGGSGEGGDDEGGGWDGPYGLTD